MGKKQISRVEQLKIVQLRERGNTVSEISATTGRAKGTISKYITGVKPLPAFENILRTKQGGSKARAKYEWEQASLTARKLLLPLTKRDLLCILIGLYWGEGAKRELNLINSDPRMVRVFLDGLAVLGVQKVDVQASIRLFEGSSIYAAKRFWRKILSLDSKAMRRVYHIKKGAKEARHIHGMCRVRVAHSAKYFKLLMSLITLVEEYKRPYS